jgi:hypothetical protein
MGLLCNQKLVILVDYFERKDGVAAFDRKVGYK